jgi:hypothetical protein
MRCRADLAAGASLSVQYERCTSSSEISAAWIGSSLSQKVKVRGMHIIYGMVDSTRESVRLSMGLGCVAWFRLMSTFGKLTSTASMYGGVTCVQRERERPCSFLGNCTGVFLNRVGWPHTKAPSVLLIPVIKPWNRFAELLAGAGGSPTLTATHSRPLQLPTFSRRKTIDHSAYIRPVVDQELSS